MVDLALLERMIICLRRKRQACPVSSTIGVLMAKGKGKDPFFVKTSEKTRKTGFLGNTTHTTVY
jgi:hypothetical protein